MARRGKSKSKDARVRPPGALARVGAFLDTWPGRIVAVLGIVGAVFAAWAQIKTLFPADVRATLSCADPNELVVTVINEGGRSATIGQPTFLMASRARWPDGQMHDRSIIPLEDPVAAQGPEIPAGGYKPFSFRTGEPYYYPDDLGEGECRFIARIPVHSDRGEESAESSPCVCGQRSQQ